MKILFPWKNLGCLGLKWKYLYIDIYRSPQPGLFISNGSVKIWVSLWTGFIKVEGPDGVVRFSSRYSEQEKGWENNG